MGGDFKRKTCLGHEKIGRKTGLLIGRKSFLLNNLESGANGARTALVLRLIHRKEVQRKAVASDRGLFESPQKEGKKRHRGGDGRRPGTEPGPTQPRPAKGATRRA
jgi:hypothetical protein